MKPLDEKKFRNRLVWLNVRLFALAGGLLSGFVLFAATNWLVLKGGKTVGPHLRLLDQFFIGYSVTFTGSIVGFFYGFLAGGFAAGLIAYIYNRLTDFDRNGSM
ncbi:MAG: hypothetical protein V1793_09660 [Pseudomonadota bacterium]